MFLDKDTAQNTEPANLGELAPIEQKLKCTKAVIDFDAEYYKDFVGQLTAKYQNLIVTEESEPKIRDEIAMLNKFDKAINDQRIALAKQINEPVKAFEAQVKDVTTIIKETVLTLKTQCDVFEDKRRNAKSLVVGELLKLMVNGSTLGAKYVKLVVIKDAYLNKSMTTNKIKEDIQATINNFLLQQENEDKARALDTQRLANRELKLQNLNAKFNMKVLLSDVVGLPDEQLEAHFVQLEAKKIAVEIEQEKATISNVEQAKIISPANTQDLLNEPVAEIVKPPVTNNMLYKRIEVGGANMGVILQVMAELKAKGFEVKFID